MADMLATVADLRTLLGEDAAGLTDPEATLVLEMATGAVQAAAGQDLVEVTGDTITLMGMVDGWLSLPQRPVTAVTTVEVDGEAVTDYKRFGDRLWRESGWASGPYEPSEVAVTYDHGYATGDRRLQLARQATLAVAAQVFSNPAGGVGFSIDDYREQYAQAGDSGMAGMVPANLRQALRKAYGPRGRLVRVG